MSVASQITRSEIRNYFSRTQPDWKLNRKQIHVPCPIHGGQRDSFSVDLETGQWHCHSACGEGGDIVTLEQKLRGGSIGEAIKRVEEIVGATYAEAPRPKMNVVATYVYRDDLGKPLSRVLRLEPKDFRQQRFDNGEWKWGMGDCRRVPYRLPELLNATGPVFFVEGEKDCDRLVSMGLTATTSAEGAGKWRNELAQHFAGKVVYVIPDNDAPKEKGVRFPGQQHAAQVVRSILPVARRVMLVELSDAKDISEWIDMHGADDFSRVVNGASMMTPERLAAYELRYADQIELIPELALVKADAEAKTSAKATKKPDGRHPNAVAMEILEHHKVISCGKEGVWEYNNVIWNPISPEAIQQWALEAESAFATRGNRRREIANYILIRTRREDIPWRAALAEYEVPAANGVVDLRTGLLRPHRAEDFLEAVIPVRYEPGARCSVFPQALRTAWEGDVDVELKIAALQEFFGYILMTHAKYKKALLLCGVSDSGKSQVLSLMQAIVGRENCCSISVKDMDDPRKLAPIKGKMLNALSELSQTAMIADGGFKTLVSTGDAIQIDAKYEKPEPYTPYAKHVIVTNTLPRVNDLTDATFNRMLLLRFNKPIPVEKRDVDLLQKMVAEAPGVLNWAIAGAKRLYENKGEFTRVPESVEAVKEYKAQSNPVNDFIHIYCRESDGNNIPMHEFRDRFNAFRRNDTLGLPAIRRMLKSALGQASSDNWFLFNYTWKNN